MGPECISRRNGLHSVEQAVAFMERHPEATGDHGEGEFTVGQSIRLLLRQRYTIPIAALK